MRIFTTLALVVGLAAGCASAPPIETASGKPDVVMRNVNVACVREQILNHALTTGWNIKSTSDIQIVVERRAPPSLASTMLSTGFSGAPYQRVTFNLIPSGGDLRLVADAAWVSNANTGFEKSHAVRATASDQATIEGSARRAEAKCAAK